MATNSTHPAYRSHELAILAIYNFALLSMIALLIYWPFSFTPLAFLTGTTIVSGITVGISMFVIERFSPELLTK